MKRLLSLWRAQWIEIVLTSIIFAAAVNLATLGSFVAALAVLVVGLPLLGVVISVLQTIERRRFRSLGDKSAAFRQPRRGIVFTVGLQPTTILFALEKQQPTYVGFLCTEVSLPIAQKICADLGLDGEHAKVALADPFNMLEVRKETETLIHWLLARPTGVRLRRHEIVVDVTGGLTPLSLGAFSMAEEQRVDIQYIQPVFQNNVAVGIKDALLVSRSAPAGAAEGDAATP